MAVRPKRGAVLFIALVALVGSPCVWPQGDPGREIELFERALDRAVRQVSANSAAHTLGVGEGCRGYRLAGYGAVFVLTPRVLPGHAGRAMLPGAPPGDLEFDAAIAGLEEALKRVESPEIRLQITHRLEALRLTRPSRRAVPAAAPPGDKAFRAVAAQAQALEREAEQARDDAERAMDVVRDQVKMRLAPQPPTATIAPPVPPVEAAPPLPPESPAPVPSEALPPLPPPPPWRFWFEEEEARTRPPDAIIRDVRAAVTNAIETHGARLQSLAPQEMVVVAVDFFPRGSFGVWERPERTLIVRVRKKEIDDRRTGRLSPGEFRSRVEFSEY